MSNRDDSHSNRKSFETQETVVEENNFHRRTGGELFVSLLNQKGIDFVFGTTGAGMADIQNAMVVVKPPKWIQGLHEFVSVNAAAGYALASESNGVALIDRNVGTQNAAGAFYSSYLNMAPVVIFASKNIAGVPMETGQVEYHYMEYEGLLASPWVKWNSQLESLDTIVDDLAKTFYEARSEPWGPVYFTLRQDLMAMKLPSGFGQQKLMENGQRQDPVREPLRILDNETLQKIYSEIMNYSFPEVFVSHIGRRKSSYRSFLNFCHTFGLGVNDYRSFMNFPITDSLHLGFTPMTKPPKVASGVDLAIAIELGLLPHQRFGKADAIDLTSDPFHRQDVPGGGHYGSTMFPALIRGVCDVGPTLDALCKIAESKMNSKEKEAVKERTEKVARMHNETFEKARKEAESSYNQGNLTPSSVGYILNSKFPRNGLWVDGSITPRDKILHLVELEEPGTYFSNPSFHLGAVIGMSYGVALSRKTYGNIEDMETYKIGKIQNRGEPSPVICTTGDGDAIFGNIDSALWTCSHYGIGVVYVILNNACWGIEWPPIEKSQEPWAKRAGDYEFLDLENPRIDFSHIASAFGVRSKKVETTEELARAMDEGIRLALTNKPMVIDVTMEKYTGEKVSVIP